MICITKKYGTIHHAGGEFEHYWRARNVELSMHTERMYRPFYVTCRLKAICAEQEKRILSIDSAIKIPARKSHYEYRQHLQKCGVKLLKFDLFRATSLSYAIPRIKFSTDEKV